MFAGRNPQVLGVPWLFETMALLGCRFVESWRSRGCKQSCWISPRLPFLLPFSSHSLSTVELSPCCNLGLKFLGCAEAARFFKHGSASPVPSLHLPQFENLAVPSTAWLGVRDHRSRSLKADSPLRSALQDEEGASCLALQSSFPWEESWAEQSLWTRGRAL